MKSYRFLLSLFALCAVSSACSSEYQEIQQTNEFRLACENSGGVFSHKKCSCSGTVCDEWVICGSDKNCVDKSEIKTQPCEDKEMYCTNSKLYECNEKNEWRRIADDSGNCMKFGCLPDNKGCASCNENVCDFDTGMISFCENGRISSTDKCKTGRCSTSTKCLNECENGDIICKEGKLKTCVENSYKLSTCPYGCEESSNGEPSRACAPLCKDGSTLCTDGKLQTCIQGELSLPENCPNDYSCKNDKECGECKIGTAICENDEDGIGSLTECKNGVISTRNCDGNASCKSNSECGDCNINDLSSCENDLNGINAILTECDNGTRKNSYCPDDVSCNGAKCGECKDGDQKCENDKDGIGIVSKCEGGQYQETKACDNEHSCNDNVCGACKNGDKKCENDENEYGILSVCRNGIYEPELNEYQQNVCTTNSCNAAGNDCGACYNGNVSCLKDEKTLQSCDNGMYTIQSCDYGCENYIDQPSVCKERPAE